MSYEYDLGNVRLVPRCLLGGSYAALARKNFEQPKRIFSIHFYDIHTFSMCKSFRWTLQHE